MEKSPLKKIFFYPLCIFIALAFSGCVEPVGFGSFLEDEMVQEIVAGGGGSGDTRFYLVLLPVSGGPRPNPPGTINMNVGDPARSIALLNTTGISSILWVINGEVAPFHNNTSILVNPPASPFDTIPSGLFPTVTYSIFVDARTSGGIPYSAEVTVRVTH